MKYCRNCGENVTESFCKECGQAITVEEREEQSAENTAQISKQPLSLKTKAIIISASAFIFIGIILFNIGESMTSYERVIDQLEEALNEKDGKQLAKLLHGTDRSLEINEHTVQGLIIYYDENPSERGRLIKRLNEEGKTIEDEPFAPTEALSLGTKGKKYLFFDQYMIEVEPVYFEIYTNYDQTAIFMNDHEIAMSTEEEFTAEYGPFVPGTHTFTASYASEFIDLEEQEKITHMTPGEIGFVSLYLDGTMVEFDLDYSHIMEVSEVFLYLNGEDTGINIQEQREVGPLLTDGSITASYGFEAPWGLLQTGEEPIDYAYMGVGELVLDDALKTDIMETIITYQKEELSAYTSMDESDLTTATSHRVDQIMNESEVDASWGYYYAAELLGMNFYDDAFYMYTEVGDWIVDVGVDVFTNEVFSYSGSEDEKLQYTEHGLTYGMMYDNETEGWLVAYVSNYNIVSGNDPIVHEEEDPPLYKSSWTSD